MVLITLLFILSYFNLLIKLICGFFVCVKYFLFCFISFDFKLTPTSLEEDVHLFYMEQLLRTLTSI